MLEGDSTQNSVGPFQGTPKTMFYLGLFAGIALSAVLALGYVLSSISSGGGLLALGKGGTPSGQVAQAPTPTQQPTQQQEAEPPAGPVKEFDPKTDHVIGAKNAKVTLIEYSDFECPFCSRHLPTIKELLQKYPNDVRFVYRHFPLNSIHPKAQKMAEAAECAAESGGNDGFWKMHDKMFALMNDDTQRAAFTLDQLPQIAKSVGLNEAAMKTCLDSGRQAARIDKDTQEGAAAGVAGTPATFVNGQLLSGAQPTVKFTTVIDAILKK